MKGEEAAMGEGERDGNSGWRGKTCGNDDREVKTRFKKIVENEKGSSGLMNF